MVVSGPSYFEIQADDMDGAMRFYQGIFGWKFSKADGLPVDYWRIEAEAS
jgi:hypothetical protein